MTSSLVGSEMCIRDRYMEDFWKTFQSLLHTSIAEMIWSGLGHTASSKAVVPLDEASDIDEEME
eukprot:11976958-Prorocentrum_lima.AAC.1